MGLGGRGFEPRLRPNFFFFGVVGAFEIQSFFTLSVNLEGQLPWYVINLIMADNLQAVDTHPDIPNAIVMIKRL